MSDASNPTTEDPRVDAQRAFDRFWQSCLTRSEELRTYLAHPRMHVRGIAATDLRAALEEAFIAGRESL